MKPQKFSLGLTGGIGSGKSTIANLFAEAGASLIDTDLIAHQLSAPGGQAIAPIVQSFGRDYIQADGALDRQKMRELVFSNTRAKQKLEAILHPLIWQQCQDEASLAQGSYLIFVVPLLVESGRWQQRVHRILLVDCPESLQIQRVMQRNGLSQQQVLAIMQNQASRQQRLAVADDVIVNDQPLEFIQSEVNRLHQSYCDQQSLIYANSVSDQLRIHL